MHLMIPNRNAELLDALGRLDCGHRRSDESRFAFPSRERTPDSSVR